MADCLSPSCTLSIAEVMALFLSKRQAARLPRSVRSEGMDPLTEAISKAGGVGALATRIGVAASAPSMWRARKSVPAEYCPAIERETGVRCERLRPDVAWNVLREQAA